MRQRFGAIISAVVLVVSIAVFPASRAGAQAVSLQEQLVAQYKVAKLASDTSGFAVTEEGTLLEIKKGGLLGVPYSDKTTLTNKYEGGAVHPPNAAMVEARKKLFGHFSQTQDQGQTTKLFKNGDKVYPTKLDVNLEKDTVSMAIVACDTCNNTDPPTYNKAQVVFQFPKGSLAKASAGDVEDTIGQLLAVSDNTQQADQGDQQADQGSQQQGSQQGGGQQQGGQQGGGKQGGGNQQAAAAPQQAEPAEIKMGMTPDQVEGALGKPDKKVNLGAKVIYIYKDMKVTFKDGKVSDVQ
jgi:hypothetical protein